MIQATTIEYDCKVEALRDHIHDRTFGRLHDLIVEQLAEGRFTISAIAHSRFVGQLAEWAIFERLSPKDVDLSMCIRRSSPQSLEAQK
jgi:hypothetical protein